LHAQQPSPIEDPMLSLALEYSQRGVPVFPCRPADDYDPDTGEVLPEKAPLISNGFRGATVNERVIRELWKRNPGALVGIPTGERSDVWVLDLDIKSNANGHDWLAEQEAKHGELPLSARVQTANGGTHIFFRYVEGVRNRGKLGAGVDVRGEGGFVIAGGSQMTDGRAYDWIHGNMDTVEDAPQWLLDLVLPPPVTHQPGEWQYTSGANDRYVRRAIEAELDELACTPRGNRGYQLNASAFALGQFVGAGAISRQEAEYGLYAAAVTCGVAQADGERETWAKIRRGLDAGIKQPRAIPEPPADNDNTKLVDIKKMLERAREKAKAVVEQAHTQHPTHEQPQPEQPATPSPTTDSAEEDDSLFRFTPFEWKDPTKLPRREFAFGTHYIRKYVSVTAAPGGLGKTSNSVVEALSMASGKALTGDKPPQRLKVWLFNAEDPRDEMERRIMAACIHYGLSQADIDGYLYLDTGREQELIVMHEDKKAGVTINAPIVEAVAAQIRKHQIDVLIVDPFVSTHRVNENDNGAIDKVAKLWAQIADDTNCAIDVVHHLRKLADREATVEDARGAISLIGAARSVRVLNRMSVDDARAAGIDEKDRYSYFHIHYGKQNLTRMDTTQHWRKMESVRLGNGPNKLTPGDTAGVVTAWKWPSKEEMASAIPETVKQEVLVKLSNQNYRENPQSDDWAGYILAEAMGQPIDVSKSMTPDKRKVKAVLESWIDNGILMVVREDDPKHVGRKIPYVRPAENHT
jgi:hypothetical protein